MALVLGGSLDPPAQVGGCSFWLWRARRAVDLLFILALFERGLRRLPHKSGGPPPLEPSFKVQRDRTHRRNSGVVAPGLKGFNALGPSKVHLRGSARTSPATVAIGPELRNLQTKSSLAAFLDSCRDVRNLGRVPYLVGPEPSEAKSAVTSVCRRKITDRKLNLTVGKLTPFLNN
jgi:hypothetical protein